jgi:hypothetical protein
MQHLAPVVEGTVHVRQSQGGEATMNKTRVEALRRKMSDHKRRLKRISVRQRNGKLNSRYRPTLKVEDATYGLVDVKQELADLEAKKQLVDHYLELLKAPSDQKTAASRKVLEDAMQVWEQSYR